MAWAAVPLLALLLGLANHDRGRGTLPGGRWACAIISGMGIGLTAGLLNFSSWHAGWIALAATLGLYNWLVWGWGLYFASFTWQWPTGEKEVGWIDEICFVLVPMQTTKTHWTNGLRGLIGMSLRGLYLLPMFLLLDPLRIFTVDSVWWLGLFGPLQGVIYAANRIGGLWKKHGTAYPELAVGALIGALAGAALVILSDGGYYG